MILGCESVGARVLKGGAWNRRGGTDGFWTVEGCSIENAVSRV